MPRPKGSKNKKQREKVIKPKVDLKDLVPGHAGHLNQYGYEKYTQDAEEYRKDFIIALNQRFPNLVGFGVFQYLKQIMAENPRAKIDWTEQNVRKLALQMNVEESILRDVVNFCRFELNIFRFTRSTFMFDLQVVNYLIYPDFMRELIDLEVKKMKRDADIKANTYKYEKEKGTGETADYSKRRMIEEMTAFVVITPKIKEDIEAFYPKLGEPEALFNQFVQNVKKDYLKWYQLLTPENYVDNLYVFLNNHRPSKAEFLEGEI